MRLKTVRRRDSEDAAQNADEAENDPRVIRRYDRGSGLLSPHRRSDGAMLFMGRVARPGIYVYRNADGSTTRELVPRSTLHDPESLATLGRSPVVLNHPDEGDVTRENAHRLAVGDVDGRVDVEPMAAGGFVTVRLAVRSDHALQAIADGKMELSPGYVVLLDGTPGVDAEFGPFDATQLRRDYNHVAIVDAARGGPTIRLHTDAAYQVAEPLPPPSQTGPQEVTMTPKLLTLLTLLGVERFDSEEAALDSAAATATGWRDERKARADKADEDEDLAKRLKALTADNKKLADDLTAMTGERDTLQKASDTAAKASQDKADTEERKGLIELAKAQKVDTNDSMDIAAIRVAIVGKHFDGELPESMIGEGADVAMRGAIAMISKLRVDSANDKAWNQADNAERPTARNDGDGEGDPKPTNDDFTGDWFKHADEANKAHATGSN